ncbi:hypothetical protein BH09ACT3_BH09ACT3_10020 [soil metagenome]
MATLAPVVGSVAIWAITASPFALIFAALGPVIAAASVADSAVLRRRARRRDAAALAAGLADLGVAIDAEHDRERAEAFAVRAGPRELLSAPDHDPERWRASPTEPVLVSVGLGSIPSALVVGGAPPGETGAELLRRAQTLQRAPVLVDARWGIAICGPPPLATAAANAILVQLAAVLAPGSVECRADGWLGSLPHRSAAASAPGVSCFVDGGGVITVAVCAERSALPPECRVTLELGNGTGVLVAHPDQRIKGMPIEPVFVSAEEAQNWAVRLAEIAGAVPQAPLAVAFDSLRQPAPVGRRGLPARFSSGEAIDLVSDGPHAVVGGTTGSGKSELLASWILAIAATHGPHEASFLLVDFKGGASFGAISGLKHVVGLVTDLDEYTAQRAILSLRAELRLRERLLVEAGVRSIEELPPEVQLARLVVVVDEFAAVVAGFPELTALFADVAARGRSLGVHLVLCTQRPAGVVREAVLANCPLRISLRVTSRADSVAVVGTETAAALPVTPRGRAVIAAGGEPELVQVALACPADVAAIADRWADAPPPRRPWQDPLPELVPLATLPAVDRGIAFGLLDLPQEQRHGVACYDPEREGNLLVLGGHGSGTTSALAAIGSAPGSELLPADSDSAWDALVDLVTALRTGTARPRLLLIDDVDLLLLRYSDEHRPQVLDLLLELLRAGPAAGIRVVLSARRLAGGLQAIGALCGSRLLLAMPDRQEYLVAGGDSGQWDPQLPAGGGHWRGARVQVAVAGHPLSAAQRDPAPAVELDGPVAVICADPASFAARVTGAVRLGEGLGLGAGVVVGSPDEWNAEWAMLARLKATGSVVLHGVTTAELRSLGGYRGAAPPLATPGSFWLLRNGALSRARLA